MTKKTKKTGFTLVELLVVISIIALLLAILMPSLGKARQSAQRVVCLSNSKSLFTAQLVYAESNNGKFPAHTGPSAEYVHVNDIVNYPQTFWLCMQKYINSKNVCCPILSSEEGYYHRDPKWVNPSRYGGWDSGGNYILTSYAFFAGYAPLNYTLSFSRYFEPIWPKTAKDLNARQTVIAHRLTFFGNTFVEESHGSKNRSWLQTLKPFATDTPRVKGDGSAITVKREAMLPRVEQRESNGTTVSWWY